jgi:hypothetical protein
VETVRKQEMLGFHLRDGIVDNKGRRKQPLLFFTKAISGGCPEAVVISLFDEPIDHKATCQHMVNEIRPHEHEEGLVLFVSFCEVSLADVVLLQRRVDSHSVRLSTDILAEDFLVGDVLRLFRDVLFKEVVNEHFEVKLIGSYSKHVGLGHCCKCLESFIMVASVSNRVGLQ